MVWLLRIMTKFSYKQVHFVWYLTTNGPQCARLPIPPTATLPSCLWSLRIFASLPGSRLTNFHRDDVSSQLLQLVNQWLNFTQSRPHAFRYGRQNENPVTPGESRVLVLSGLCSRLKWWFSLSPHPLTFLETLASAC